MRTDGPAEPAVPATQPAPASGATTGGLPQTPTLSVALSHPALEHLARAAEALAASQPAPGRAVPPTTSLASSVAAALRAFGFDDTRIALLTEMTAIQSAIARLDQDIGLGLQLAAPAPTSPAPQAGSVPLRPAVEPEARLPLLPVGTATIEDVMIAQAASMPDRTTRPAEPAAFADLGAQREALLMRFDWLVYRWVQGCDDEPQPVPLPKAGPLPDCALPCLSACTLRGAADLRCPDEHAEKPGGACMLRSSAILSAEPQPLRLMTPPDRGA